MDLKRIGICASYGYASLSSTVLPNIIVLPLLNSRNVSIYGTMPFYNEL